MGNEHDFGATDRQRVVTHVTDHAHMHKWRRRALTVYASQNMSRYTESD